MKANGGTAAAVLLVVALILGAVYLAASNARTLLSAVGRPVLDRYVVHSGAIPASEVGNYSDWEIATIAARQLRNDVEPWAILAAVLYGGLAIAGKAWPLVASVAGRVGLVGVVATGAVMILRHTGVWDELGERVLGIAGRECARYGGAEYSIGLHGANPLHVCRVQPWTHGPNGYQQSIPPASFSPAGSSWWPGAGSVFA